MRYECDFSPCRKWRYTLQVLLGSDVSLFPRTSRSVVMFIGLNPSTADERELDPTVRRCVGFARHWGFDALLMTNLFAFRATDPQKMREAFYPVGPDNDKHILRSALKARMVVCAWGNGGAYRQRGLEVETMLRAAGVRLCCLRKTRAGFPEHPLYLPGALRPKPYLARRREEKEDD